MSPCFQTHQGIALPFTGANISTDTIIPSREMKRVSKQGLGDALFANLRYSDTARTLNQDFILNRPEFRNASILLTGENFGCGSSREHAVWALKDYGFRVIIGQSFGTIFYDNCVANGILPIQLTTPEISQITDRCAANPQSNQVLVDLTALTVKAGNLTFPFKINAAARERLAKGLNPIDVTLQQREAIIGFMTRDRQARGWLYSDKGNTA